MQGLQFLKGFNKTKIPLVATLTKAIVKPFKAI